MRRESALSSSAYGSVERRVRGRPTSTTNPTNDCMSKVERALNLTARCAGYTRTGGWGAHFVFERFDTTLREDRVREMDEGLDVIDAQPLESTLLVAVRVATCPRPDELRCRDVFLDQVERTSRSRIPARVDEILEGFRASNSSRWPEGRPPCAANWPAHRPVHRPATRAARPTTP